MRILIANVYSYKNKGDAAIVISLLREVRRVFPGADIMVQTADALHDEGKYDAPITHSLLWTLLSRVRTRPMPLRLWTLVQGLAGLYTYLGLHRMFGSAPRFVVPKNLRPFVQENEQADLVIACGGGYLRTQTAGIEDWLLLKVTCLNFLAAKYLGKPVFLYSQSIGPVHGDHQLRMLRKALNKVDVIEPREDVSVKFLKSLNLTTPIVPTADPALLLGGTGVFPADVAKLHEGRLHVGLTVRKWFKTEQELENYIDAIAQTLDYLIEQYNAEIFYIPQVIAENFGDDDRVIARRVWSRSRNQDRFTVIEADLHPFEMIGFCAQLDMFIGTRMHSNIFALINHVPVVAIEYEHKTRGIMRGLGLEPLTIDIRDVTFASLRQRVDTLLADRAPYQRLIKQHLPAQVTESRKAMEVIKEVYEAKTI